ncbi:hypothetical protein FSP39_004460 [Pinctada imbricata]|uniref:BCD1 alpha/beta domain-containing protein n=1 Tax=Pinctada imbricata TaxID=66713 RepID=A0AA88XKY3_PINIB|nr:hypothetical protein FSP39_004460 [Pinctada imbricata]
MTQKTLRNGSRHDKFVIGFIPVILPTQSRFLEEAGRIADNSKRDPKKRRITHAGYLNQIKRAALKRDIKLKFLPFPMMRRKNNTTTLSNYHYGDILWHVELVFPEAEAKYTESRVNENTTLQDILRGYIHPTESDPVKRQKLKSYCVTGSEDYKVFLRKERSPANDVR